MEAAVYYLNKCMYTCILYTCIKSNQNISLHINYKRLRRKYII